ncbi:hypothetical protein FVE85_7120 [Porphyridium purpureum]|uniref:BZIP domain-containing protein n=1 Tax=Porphyridium purpureum TaxID=35688 RepID=A0A5J4Z8A5_PORPP|nr:hypothetical protein FVE85_7120 [Porphyridium purpureum]|eukprot:POR7637..scf295_1
MRRGEGAPDDKFGKAKNRMSLRSDTRPAQHLAKDMRPSRWIASRPAALRATEYASHRTPNTSAQRHGPMFDEIVLCGRFHRRQFCCLFFYFSTWVINRTAAGRLRLARAAQPIKAAVRALNTQSAGVALARPGAGPYGTLDQRFARVGRTCAGVGADELCIRRSAKRQPVAAVSGIEAENMDAMNFASNEWNSGDMLGLPTLPSFDDFLFPEPARESEPVVQHVDCEDGSLASTLVKDQDHCRSFASGVTSSEISNTSKDSIHSDDSSPPASNLQVSVNGQHIKVDPKALEDLSGCTASAARRMSPEDRAVMLMKRKLRNRESAKRSRAKRMQTVDVLQDQVRRMSREAEELRQRCEAVALQNAELRRQNVGLTNALATAHESHNFVV